jgi:hypothetical protein
MYGAVRISDIVQTGSGRAMSASGIAGVQNGNLILLTIGTTSKMPAQHNDA